MTECKPAERLNDLLETIADGLDLEAEVRVEDDGEVLRGSFEGEDVASAIGRRGQMLDAIGHVAARCVFRGCEEPRRVIIDADGYREKRNEELERHAAQAASDAVKGGRPISLEPMSASERRVIHEYLRDQHGIETYSEGDEPRRYLVVAPVASID